MCPTRGFYSLTYRVRPYYSEQPRPSYAGRTIPCGDISMWTGILCRTWETIVYKGARSGGQNGNPGNNIRRKQNEKNGRVRADGFNHCRGSVWYCAGPERVEQE